MNRFPTSPSSPARPAFRRGLRWSVAALTVLLAVLPLAARPQYPAAGRLAREADAPSTFISPAPFPSWTYDDRDQVGSLLGSAVAVAGDLNGDGYSDAVVGAERYTVSVETEGAAFVFLGSSRGLSIEPTWVTGSGRKGARFGGAVAGAGDVNGDGFDDILIGAYRYNPVLPEEGAAFVYLGSANGPELTPAWIFLGGQKSAQLGSAIAGAGDINGDGFDDILVGAPLMENDPANVSEGMAFLFLGSEGGPSVCPDWSQSGGVSGAQFGAALAGVGDVNGDGYADILVGSPNPVQQGRVDLYYGAADGLSSLPDWTASDLQTGSRFGTAVAGAGDLNHDGYADFIVGAPEGRSGDLEVGGMVYVYFGSATGPSDMPTWSVYVNQSNAFFGATLSGAGDANGDGYDDFLVGAPNYTQTKPQEGGIFLYTGQESTTNEPELFWKTFGDKAEAFLGRAVSGGADFNLDSRIDLAAGAPEYNLETVIVGRSMAYYGQEVTIIPIKSVFVPVLYKMP